MYTFNLEACSSTVGWGTITPCGFLRMWTEMVMPKKLFPLIKKETDTQKEFYLLGYNIIQPADVQRNMLPPSSG
jgi:hypothetical protein